MVIITFDDAVNSENWDLYTKKLFVPSRLASSFDFVSPFCCYTAVTSINTYDVQQQEEPQRMQHSRHILRQSRVQQLPVHPEAVEQRSRNCSALHHVIQLH